MLLRALQRAVGRGTLGPPLAGPGAGATPLGVRPLHLCEHGGRLYFASEVKAIFAAEPAIPRALDRRGWVRSSPSGRASRRGRCSRRDRAGAGHVRIVAAEGVRPVLLVAGLPRGRRWPLPRLAGEAAEATRAAGGCQRLACAARRRPWAATCRAARQLPCGGDGAAAKAGVSPRSRSASTTPSMTKHATSSSW